MPRPENAEIYLDNNATTRPLPEVRQAMLHVLSEGFGNPSSSHSAGERVRRYLREAREHVGALIGSDPSNVVFTSSATEANNMVFHSCFRGAEPRRRVVSTKVEHSSILRMCDYLSLQGAEIVLLPVGFRGCVNLGRLEESITENTALVSIQWVNNETGIIQPIAEIAEICRRFKTLFHTDAAQAVGKLEMKVRDLPIDFLTFSGHKFHGPQGVGAIYARDRIQLSPLLYGGSQEDGFRPGTENVAGIIGMGKAAELRRERLEAVTAKMKRLRDTFECIVLNSVAGTEVNGDRQNRVGNTTNILFKGTDGHLLLKRLDREGIFCSQSSACTNMRPEPSYVLRSMGLSEDDARSSVRFCFSEENTLEETEYAAETVVGICRELGA